MSRKQMVTTDSPAQPGSLPSGFHGNAGMDEGKVTEESSEEEEEEEEDGSSVLSPSWRVEDEKALVAALRAQEFIEQQNIDNATELERTAVTVLYAKGVVDHMLQGQSAKYVLPMVRDVVRPGHDANPQVTKENKGRRARLMRLVDRDSGDASSDSANKPGNTGDKSSNQLPPMVQSWEQFLEQVTEWAAEATSFVFHRDHPEVKPANQRPCCLVQRVQLSGLCYLHGPDVLQHYLVALGAKEPTKRPGMVDLTKYIRGCFNGKQLYGHIFTDAGGGSVGSLRDMLLPSSRVVARNVDEITVETLLEYGPALVSSFQVREDFNESGSLSYTGVPTGDVRGGHAMVLIGVRGEGNGRRFLLQNWWVRKQFVEVDAEYLEGCEAQIHFVRTPQGGFREELPQAAGMYAETDMIDGEDRLPLDG